MAIIYYPNRVFKGKVPAIDRVMAKRNPVSSSFGQSIASNPMSQIISSNENWQVDAVSFTFNNVASKDYGFGILGGRKVVQDLNDYLWFQITGSLPQIITLTPGFYNGTQLATELQTRLNAATLLNGNTNIFFTAGVTFTVTYDSVTGLFTITPSTNKILYLNVNYAQVLPLRDSIAGHLFGFNVTTSLSSSITSDTAVMGLNDVLEIVNSTGASDISFYHDTKHTLTMDQAIYLTANSASNVAAISTIVYETLV